MGYVKGEVKYRLYYDNESLYGIYKVLIDETDEDAFKNYGTISVAGYFNMLEINSTYIFKGKTIISKKYGFTFQSETFERVLPSSKEGLIEFLSGDAFRGIGKKKASLIVDELGLDCVKIILNDRGELDKVKGLSESNKDTIYEVLLETEGIEEILVTLYSYGITPKISMRIYEKYKMDTLKIIKENPYKLIDDVEGIAFLKADKIAMSTGINPKSTMRIEACIEYLLGSDSEDTGNTYLDEVELIEKAKNYLAFDRDELDIIKASIESLIFRGRIVKKDDTLSLSALYYSEQYIANKIMLMEKEPKTAFFKEEIKRLISELEKELDIEYEDRQKDAIYNALTNNVSIITGGPGTGKTTIEKGIIYVYSQLVRNNTEFIYLAAPTGKAAKRIEESTGYSAFTIHRTLGYSRSGIFTYNRLNPLPAKLMIIDEASMIDTYLFKRLLEALNNDTKLVIVGDSNQLPSIGPGQVLKDLIDSKMISTTLLNKIHRQKKDSKIISLAYDILDEDIKTELDKEHEELTYIPSTQNHLLECLYQTINHFLGKGYSLLSDIQILIPIYKSGVGIDYVNKFIQETYNSNFNNNIEVESNTFFIDDKVIQLVNQYEDFVMNGDMGVISDFLGEKELSVDYQGNIVTYKGKDISNISLAYAISVHKSQGSEFPVVILPIFNQYHPVINKKLLYTAVTRAKNYLVIIGDIRTLNRAIKIESLDRKTRIKDFLNE